MFEPKRRGDRFRFSEAPRWFKILFALAIVNFLWLFFESLSIGGDGLTGQVRDGHYFVSNHGRLTEVSRGWYVWSAIHALSVIALHSAAIASWLVLAWRGRRAE